MPVLIILLLSLIAHAVTITIPNGANSKWIANHLEEQGVVNHGRPLYMYFRVKSIDKSLQSGQFEIEKGASYKAISDILTGKVQQTVSVTIPEGYTLHEIANELKKRAVIQSESEFMDYLKEQVYLDFSSMKWLQQMPSKNLEGYLFPDTYFFSKSMTNRQVVLAFMQRFEQVFLPMYENSDKKLSFHDTLTLASIIEKEAGIRDEMPLISGVFHNRLNRNMHLASCPTVGYAMGKPRKKLLTYKDLEYPSPYNTYRNIGLPPSPIAAPGKQAFQAAMYPKKTHYLYFVSRADGSRRHQFSTNLRDHLSHQKRIMAKK